MSDHKSVTVSVIPTCDVNPDHGPAYADAKILRPEPGPWGNFCKPCFDSFGCRLGLGFGQELIKREENVIMWYLLTDRKLKGFQLYGPFPTADAADNIGRALLSRNRIKSGWTVVIAQVPPRLENGTLVTTAEI